jgi:lipoate-protein ligase B
MLDAYQREIAHAILEDGAPGRVLISELAPVITVGRRAQLKDEVLLSPEELMQSGVSLYSVDRGGLATYHGPGQWVVFVVESLERLTGDRKGVRKAVDHLLDRGAQYLSEAGLPEVEIKNGTDLGIWSRGAKYSALGVQIQKGVLLHGIAINIYKTPLSFVGLRPCGLDLPVGFLWDTLKLGKTDDRDQAAETYFEAQSDKLKKIFGS